MLYVLNVVMNKERDIVLMIKKNRPDWQAGKYNFVGGKIENGDESSKNAAIRETKEECGLDTNPELVGIMRGEEFRIDVFRSLVDVDDIDNAEQLTDEELEIFTMFEWDELLDLAIDNVLEILYICHKEKPQFFEFKY